MVKITPVTEDTEFAVPEEKIQDNEADYTDTESEVSDDEFGDCDVENETLLDRIVALKDVIPPQYRSKFVASANTLYSRLSSGLLFGGHALWVVTTSSLLLGVPLALSIISEQQLTEMEKEMKLNQSTNELLAPGAESGFRSQPSP